MWRSAVLGFALLSVVLAALARRSRQSQAGQRFAEFESGRRCVGCDSASVVIDGDRVRCVACGYETTLSAIRKERIGINEVL